MLYYQFDTEEAALTSEAAIVANVAAWTQLNAPSRFHSNGPALRGVRASDGSVVTDRGLTTRWAAPSMTAAGAWVIPVPTAEDVWPMLLSEALAGISASTVEDPEWPPASDEFYGGDI